MAKVRAAVIGASGLVGRALARALENSRYEVSGTYGTRAADGLVFLDIRDSAAVREYFCGFQPDIVFLTAALTNVDYCEDHPEEAFATNVEGTRHVAREAAQCGCKLVFYSTDYVFDGKNGPYEEEAEASPVSVYGRSKLEAEKAVQEIVSDYLMVRTTVVYGWDRQSKNFAMQLYQKLQGGATMAVPEDQIGNPTLVDYLAEASIRLVQQGTRGIVNVVGKDLLPRSEFAKALARVFGLDPAMIVPVSTASLKQRAERPLRGGLKVERLSQLLGTEAMSLEEAFKRLRRQWRGDAQITYVKAERKGESAGVAKEILDRVKRYYELVHKERGFVPFKTPISYAGRVFGEQEMINLVDSALDFWLTLGPYGDQFERKMRSFFGARDFILVNSGSSATLLSVACLMPHDLEGHLEKGDEVITPAVTFPSTLAPIVQNGLIPVLVDAEVGTYNINPCLIEKAISPRTRALFIPHTLGNPCDMDIICDIARRHQFFLIEDACDALGSTFRGRLVGSFGDIGTLSFFPAHHITTGEGGGVIVNSSRFSKVARSLRDWGRDCWCAPGESNTCTKRFGWHLGDLPAGYDHKYIYSHIGYNLKPTDLQAAVGVAQADRIQDFVQKRRDNFQKLYRALEPYQDFIILPRLDPRSQPAWFGFPITVKSKVSKRELVQWLEAAKIETRAVFGGNILRQPGYTGIECRVAGELTQSDVIMRDTFFIGVYPGLTEEMVNFMIARLQSFFDQL
ncbi:MAG: lipopolysaccharide biosynthesis protein RfbH [Deltaproteobacteria bacterium]|nr:lipopolysaccharide biosynthesis protein RfbH [Deltaproteobacteria bacterium]